MNAIFRLAGLLIVLLAGGGVARLYHFCPENEFALVGRRFVRS